MRGSPMEAHPPHSIEQASVIHAFICRRIAKKGDSTSAPCAWNLHCVLVGVAPPFHHGRAVFGHTRDLPRVGDALQRETALSEEAPPSSHPSFLLAPCALASAPPHCYTATYVA